MAYQVLSRKYRPKRFQDVVGQEHVTRSFQNAIAKDRLGHAYILTGTRGIGKTSVARIFAKSLRCLNRGEDANPCNSCEGCKEFDAGSSMNVLEIDGASNNSVDDIRELVNNVQTLPTFGHYKVYIIDEVHMLSTSAFNALLKTLEEPPEHTVFLLATTEPHKLLDTVLSRCIRFDFRNASVETLFTHIKTIAKTEGIVFENEELIKILAQQGNGSFRDTLSLMDQVLSFSDDQNVTEDVLSVALGLAKVSAIRELGESILLGKSEDAVNTFRKMLFENVSVSNITTGLLDFYYNVIENVDHLEKVELSSEAKTFVENATIDELFWVFESLSRDFSWAIDSISPEKTISVVLQKHARRGDILRGTGLSVSDTLKKKELTPEALPPPNTLEDNPPPGFMDGPEEIKEVQEVEEERGQDTGANTNIDKEKEDATPSPVSKGNTWQDFELFLKKEIPAIYAELEQGNVLEELEIGDGSAYIKYGFSHDSKLFYDHLVDGEGKEKIEGLMKSFFAVPEVRLELILIELNDKSDFLSKSEIREKKRQQALSSKEEQLRSHPIIKEAERLFGRPIDKVKIEEE